MSLAELVAEGERIFTICNACRYCEGYCAVFPAMERRLTFGAADLDYLANLCHNCGECYYACQYAPPHEFAVNVPRTLAELRAASYRQHAWPQAAGVLFERNGLVAALVLVACVVATLIAAAVLLEPGGLFRAVPGGDFYAVVPHRTMAVGFGGVGLYVLAALGIGFVRFWRHCGESFAELKRPFAWREALGDVLSLRYLHGGGVGCTYPGEQPSLARKWFHHLTFYGFMLCFAATVTGTIYHYGFGWIAPYGYTSLPVLLGTLGGVGLLVGPAGLLWLKAQRDPETDAPAQAGMDIAFTVLLFLTSLTGLVLLVLRETPLMGLLLVVHLGVVLALFLTLPYGKFVHGIYRGAALVRYALERVRPRVFLGGDG